MEKQKCPEIRFKGFDEIWKKQYIGDLTKVSSASRVHKEEWQLSGVPFFRSSDVVSSFKGLKNSKAFISFELYEKLIQSSGKLEKDDLLITGGGSIGIPYKIPDNNPIYSKDADLIWVKKSKKIDSQYLYSYFSTGYFQKYISSISHIGTIAHYTIEQVKATPLYLPEVDEQVKIGSFVEQLQQTISLSEKRLLQSQNFKESMLEKMLPTDRSKQPEIRLTGFTGDWEKIELDNIFTFLRGEKFSKSDISQKGTAQCIHYGELFTKYDAVIKNVLSKTSLIAENFGKVGDILMPSSDVTPDGLARASSLQVDNVYLGGDINVLRPKKICCSNFFSYLINHHKQKILLCVTGTTVKHVYNKDLRNITYMVPNYDEQIAISEFFQKLDETIKLQQQQLQTLKNLKQAFLEKMFV